MSFKFWTNEALTNEFGGLYQLVRRTDLSDNPQDRVLYLGSTDDTLELLAFSDPGNDDIIITVEDILPNWEPETAYDVGDRVQPTTPNGYVYECTSAGTTNNTEPTFPTGAIGDTVVDGTVTWTLRSARHETGEITLATSAEDLATNTPGASLNLGTSIQGGVENAQEIHIRFNNAVTNVSNNTGHADLALHITESDTFLIPAEE
jgi:hypothetical protein